LERSDSKSIAPPSYITNNLVLVASLLALSLNLTLFATGSSQALLLIHDSGGHPNVCGLRDMYEDNKHFYLILDLITGGEMFEHLIQNGAYSEHDAARLMTHVASALNFLHGIGIVHADLKVRGGEEGSDELTTQFLAPLACQPGISVPKLPLVSSPSILNPSPLAHRSLRI